MIDALLGSVITVVATGALVLLVEVSESAISPAPRPCSEYEKEVVVSATKSISSMSYDQAIQECERVSQWMAGRRSRQ